MTRLRPIALVLALLSALGAAGCGGEMTFTANFDPEFAFEAARTSWAWLPNPPERSSRLNDDILSSRIRATIARQLGARGFQERTVAAPDYYVNYDVSLERKFDVYTTNNYYGYSAVGWGYVYYSPGPTVTQTTVREYTEGTLLIDLLDPATRRLVWRGTATADLEEGLDSSERQARLDQAVAGILDQFPPR